MTLHFFWIGDFNFRLDQIVAIQDRSGQGVKACTVYLLNGKSFSISSISGAEATDLLQEAGSKRV